MYYSSLLYETVMRGFFFVGKSLQIICKSKG